MRPKPGFTRPIDMRPTGPPIIHIMDTGRTGAAGFVFFGDPFYDPFYYSYIPPTIEVPYRVVTFSNGRVMSFQYLSSGY